MPRFTLRDIFVATTLIAVGVYGLIFANQWCASGSMGETVGIIGSFSLIAVGMGVPIVRDWQ